MTARSQDRSAATVDLARGYAVPDSEAHINRLACAVLALAEENERLRDALERVYQVGRGPHVAIAREALDA